MKRKRKKILMKLDESITESFSDEDPDYIENNSLVLPPKMKLLHQKIKILITMKNTKKYVALKT